MSYIKSIISVFFSYQTIRETNAQLAESAQVMLKESGTWSTIDPVYGLRSR